MYILKTPFSKKSPNWANSQSKQLQCEPAVVERWSKQHEWNFQLHAGWQTTYRTAAWGPCLQTSWRGPTPQSATTRRSSSRSPGSRLRRRGADHLQQRKRPAGWSTGGRGPLAYKRESKVRCGGRWGVVAATPSVHIPVCACLSGN